MSALGYWKTKQGEKSEFLNKTIPQRGASVTGDREHTNKAARILSRELSAELCSAPGNVALQAGGKPPSCQEFFSKTLPLSVCCNCCQKKMYGKTCECCLFMLCLTQRCKGKCNKKGWHSEGEVWGSVSFFIPAEWLPFFEQLLASWCSCVCKLRWERVSLRVSKSS